jgi:hypothetical protein
MNLLKIAASQRLFLDFCYFPVVSGSKGGTGQCFGLTALPGCRAVPQDTLCANDSENPGYRSSKY